MEAFLKVLLSNIVAILLGPVEEARKCDVPDEPDEPVNYMTRNALLVAFPCRFQSLNAEITLFLIKFYLHFNINDWLQLS